MQYDYLAINYAPVLGLFQLLLFLLANKTLPKEVKKYFYQMICIMALEITCYSIELWTSTFDRPTFARIFLSVVGYSIRPLLGYLVLIVFIRKRHLSKTGKLLLHIPEAINVAVACTAFFCDISFGYDETNTFYRGPLGYTPFFVIVIYFALITYYIFKDITTREMLESLVAIIIILLQVISMLVEAAFNVRTIGRTSIVFAVLFYYMYFMTTTYTKNMREVETTSRRYLEESRTDGLTGLLNKKAFESEIVSILDSFGSGTLAFFFIDMDHFKDVNDVLGHAKGDEVIVDTAKKIKEIFRSADLIGRFGGDEFCVLIKNIPQSTLEQRLDEARDKLHSKYTDSNRRVSVSASIGVAFYEGDNPPDYETIFAAADAASYKAKSDGKDRYVINNVG